MMKVQICGRSVWNYAGQQRMARAGWLHFSIMAEDCSFDTLLRQGRPGGGGDDFFSEDVIQLGLVPFYMDLSARERTTYTHLDSLSRKNIRG
ncbi:hypothetical protein VTI74DRAFT_652 [Chaetomium olivicolor]